jgi:hypothetical protein
MNLFGREIMVTIVSRSAEFKASGPAPIGVRGN